MSADPTNAAMFYNDATGKIWMRLGDVYDQAVNMRDDLDAIDTAWANAMWWWNQLKLSWVGKTPQEVEAFQAEIDKVQNEIFGTSKPNPDDPNKQLLDKPGLYQQVRELAFGAVQNYNWTDFGVSNMFTQISSDITGESYACGTGPDDKFVTIKPQDKPKQGELASDKTDPYITETFH
jgi:hypothetical protein